MKVFHYNDIKNKYDGKAEILLKDTNSLTNKIQTENFYENLFKDKYFSHYPLSKRFKILQWWK